VLSRNECYDGPDTYEAALQRAEESASLPPSGLQSALGFGQFGYLGGGEAYGAAVFDPDWSLEEVVATLEEGGEEFTEDEYTGTTTYTNGCDRAEVVLGDGRYALGTREATVDATDVVNGVGSALQGADDATRDGYVRYTAEVPADSVPSRVPLGGEVVELDAYDRVTHSGGTLYSTGEQVGVEMAPVALDQQAASEVADQTEAAFTVAASMEDTPDDVEAALERVTVGQDGGAGGRTRLAHRGERRGVGLSDRHPKGPSPVPATPKYDWRRRRRYRGTRGRPQTPAGR
jgi:hypothetical protein